jgi:hypothetical protein
VQQLLSFYIPQIHCTIVTAGNGMLTGRQEANLTDSASVGLKTLATLGLRRVEIPQHDRAIETAGDGLLTIRADCNTIDRSPVTIELFREFRRLSAC